MIRDRLRKDGPRVADDHRVRGFEAVVLENRWLRVTILPELGSDIVEFMYKPGDVDVMWRAPAGFWTLERPLPADIVGGREFLDCYPGGWQEILPNGGTPSSAAGAEFPEHGELPLLAWRAAVVADEPGLVAVHLTARTLRTPLHVSKTISMREGPSLFVEETVTNLGADPVDAMWGHHPALGAPFLDAGCVIDVPATSGVAHPAERFATQRLAPGSAFTWPRAEGIDGSTVDLSVVQPPGAGTADLVYLTDVEEGWCAVTNPRLELSFGLAWTREAFRHLWYWHDANGTPGYPWYGRGYVLALEPFSSYPSSGIAAAIANGTAVRLEAGESRTARMTASMGTGLRRVARVDLDGTFRARRQD